MQNCTWERNNEGNLTYPDLFDFYFVHEHFIVIVTLVEKTIPFTIELPLTFI